MGGLGSLVSSRLSFYNENPSRSICINEIDHEIDSMQERKKVSGALAASGGIISLVAIAGLLGAGFYLVGALLAIAAVAGLYSYCCSVAEKDLKAKRGDLATLPNATGVLPGAEKAGRQAGLLAN